MRRLCLVPLLLGLLLVAPTGAQAATPGVNIAGLPTAADLDQAQATGAKFVRVFVTGNQMPDHATFAAIAAGASARGLKVVYVLTGNADGSNTPPDPTAFANAASGFAAAMPAGTVAAYEIWNEEDETDFWGAAVDAARYSAILKAAYPRIKQADPSAKVLLGPLTGNNYNFLGQIYAAGAGASFDAVGVHTDTACLVDPPSSYYREDGNVARFTFLGFRTVHDVMAANGDGAKPIWMTELGWTTATSTCARGMWAGQKPAGVSEAAQAANLKEAYHCLAAYPYVETGLWFTLKDTTNHGEELNHYGLQRADNATHKPAWDAFHSVATQGDQLSGPCGDFDAPSLTIDAPATSEKYVQTLTISAVATDATSVARITFQADGNEIRNFTGTAVGSGKAVTLEWQGAKNLAFGPHTISVIALDPQGNTSTQSVQVTRVKTLPATLKTRIELGKVKVGKGRKASVSGRVLKTASSGLSGKVRVYWQQKRKGKWKTIHGGLKPANKPFTFKQKLKSAGTWRVMVKYVNVAPYKASTALSKTMRVAH